MNKCKLRGIGLQFFAEGNDDSTPDDAQNQANSNENNTNPEANSQNNTTPKTFTQEDVNRMLANEKRQGRQAALKALGLDPNDKDAEKKAKAILDAQKTEAEKVAEALKLAQDAQAEANKKAEAAEQKLTVLSSGCKAEFVDEVTALAAAKTDENTNFEAALKAVKEKCAMFFGEDSSDPGTGGGQGHKKQGKNDKAGSLGKRLGESMASSKTQKNPYFSN